MLVVVLLLAAAWGTLHGWIVPRIGDFRVRLQQQAGRALGVPVRIGTLSARSDGLIPALELGDVALLDAHGISHAVLVQPSFLGTDNRFLLEALRAAPQRLQGVAVVAPDIGEPAWQALADGGICGIRLNLVGLPLPDLTQSDWQRLLARAEELLPQPLENKRIHVAAALEAMSWTTEEPR